MRIARIKSSASDAAVHAVVEEDGYHLITGDLFGRWERSGEVLAAAEAKLLAPVEPRQILAIGLNYAKHAAETGATPPTAPLLFIKASSALIGPGDTIRLPRMAPDEVDYEAELVIVIGRTCKCVTSEQAPEYILGYTCGNDVSARDCQQRYDRQWARAKSFDTFAPMGPWIETDLDPDNLRIRSTLNGKVMQDGHTSDLIFPCMDLVSYLSQCMTLLPGSVILTGTPSGVGVGRDPKVFLRDQDRVTISIEGIGELTNSIGMA